MSTISHTTITQRAGEWLGRACRRLRQQERRLVTWLSSKGWNVRAATFLLRATALVVLAGLLGAVAWLVLLVLLVLGATYLAREADWETNDEQQPKWQNGSAGYGLYTYDGYRIDPHVFDDD